MKPIFDQHATFVGWTGDNAIYEKEGHLVAVIDEGSIFNMSGNYLGQFDEELFRDKLGCVIGFIEGACTQAVLPEPDAAALTLPAVWQARPANRFEWQAPERWASPLLNLSSLSWSEFLDAKEATFPWEVERVRSAHSTTSHLDDDEMDDAFDDNALYEEGDVAYSR